MGKRKHRGASGPPLRKQKGKPKSWGGKSISQHSQVPHRQKQDQGRDSSDSDPETGYVFTDDPEPLESAIAHPCTRRGEVPLPHGYSKSQRVLLVGEGDFSFTRALTRLLGTGANLVATAFDSREVVHQKYAGAADIEEELLASGVVIKYAVDATRLAASLHVGKNRRKAGVAAVLTAPFDRIVFNFPHIGLGIKSEAANVQKNKELLWGFLQSAAQLLTDQSPSGGEIHVALKTGKPYSLWNVSSMARPLGLLCKPTLPFHPDRFPGYAHRRTLGHVEGLSAPDNQEIAGKARTFVFALQTG